MLATPLQHVHFFTFVDKDSEAGAEGTEKVLILDFTIPYVYIVT